LDIYFSVVTQLQAGRIVSDMHLLIVTSNDYQVIVYKKAISLNSQLTILQ